MAVRTRFSVIHSPPCRRRWWVGEWFILMFVALCPALFYWSCRTSVVGCSYKKLLDCGIKYSCRHLCMSVFLYLVLQNRQWRLSVSRVLFVGWPMTIVGCMNFLETERPFRVTVFYAETSLCGAVQSTLMRFTARWMVWTEFRITTVVSVTKRKSIHIDKLIMDFQ